MPKRELKNSAKINDPDCVSLSDQRTERLGSIGPRKVITTPVSRKSMCRRTVPVVVIGNFPLRGGPEFMIYDECKLAASIEPRAAGGPSRRQPASALRFLLAAHCHMLNGKRIAVVMPAYNAEKTLQTTVRELPETVDIRILVDDHSSDRTVEVARELGLVHFVHDRNYGYGRNQQTCYTEALAEGADVVIMLHPDYQYTPLLVTAMASLVAYGVYDVVLGSRIIGGQALRGGMPVYKYISNRLLTAFENIFLGVKLSEYHTGYRAFSSKVLTTLPLMENSPDFVFDNQMLAQCVHFGFRIGEVSCPTKYFEEASSINFSRSVKYGLEVLATTLQFAAQKVGLLHLPRFSQQGRKLETEREPYYASRTEAARSAQ